MIPLDLPATVATVLQDLSNVRGIGRASIPSAL